MRLVLIVSRFPSVLMFLYIFYPFMFVLHKGTLVRDKKLVVGFVLGLTHPHSTGKLMRFRKRSRFLLELIENTALIEEKTIGTTN